MVRLGRQNGLREFLHGRVQIATRLRHRPLDQVGCGNCRIERFDALGVALRIIQVALVQLSHCAVDQGQRVLRVDRKCRIDIGQCLVVPIEGDEVHARWVKA